MSVVASSTGAIVLDYQPVALRQVGALPLDLMDAHHQPGFSAVRLDDRQRWRCSVGVGYGPPKYLPPVLK
jgi:hypothetical protein